MSRTNLTILDPVAYAEHLEQQNLEAIQELDELLNKNQQLNSINTSNITLSEPSGSSFWLIGAVCAAAGLAAGVMLTGWII